jgi:hypothetical protein
MRPTGVLRLTTNITLLACAFSFQERLALMTPRVVQLQPHGSTRLRRHHDSRDLAKNAWAVRLLRTSRFSGAFSKVQTDSTLDACKSMSLSTVGQGPRRYFIKDYLWLLSDWAHFTHVQRMQHTRKVPLKKSPRARMEKSTQRQSISTLSRKETRCR